LWGISFSWKKLRGKAVLELEKHFSASKLSRGFVRS